MEYRLPSRSEYPYTGLITEQLSCTYKQAHVEYIWRRKDPDRDGDETSRTGSRVA